MKNKMLPFVLTLFIISACNTVDSGEGKDSLSYQVPKCLSDLNKLSSDSCFTYTFSDNLVIDFCVQGNCCPDSNRFTFIQRQGLDTLELIVTDVEENLCRCTCSYLLHSEFTGLTGSSYILNVYRQAGADKVLLYSKNVVRNSFSAMKSIIWNNLFAI